MNKRGLAAAEVVTLREVLERGYRDPVIFTRMQAPGAWSNGSRVRKILSDPGDPHAVGDEATVLGSLGPLEGEYGYFVRWDDLDVPVFVVGRKLALLEGG